MKKNKPELCEYCNKNKAIHYFKTPGKWCCGKRIESCPWWKVKQKKGVSESMTDERKQKISESVTELWKDETYRKKRIEATRIAMNKPKTKRRLSERSLRMWRDPNCKLGSKEHRRKQSKNTKANFKNPEYLKKWQEGQHAKPNRIELMLIDLLEKLFQTDYEFVGDYKFWVDGKNPDFVNCEKKKVIEYFGYYLTEDHTGTPNHIHEQERIDHFKTNGYDCLVLWEEDLSNQNQLIQKIMNFDDGNKDNINE